MPVIDSATPTEDGVVIHHTDGTSRTMSYAEFLEMSERAAAVLPRLQPGEELVVFQGVPYIRHADGKVDDEDGDAVGTWDAANGTIKWLGPLCETWHTERKNIKEQGPEAWLANVKRKLTALRLPDGLETEEVTAPPTKKEIKNNKKKEEKKRLKNTEQQLKAIKSLVKDIEQCTNYNLRQSRNRVNHVFQTWKQSILPVSTMFEEAEESYEKAEVERLAAAEKEEKLRLAAEQREAQNQAIEGARKKKRKSREQDDAAAATKKRHKEEKDAAAVAAANRLAREGKQKKRKSGGAAPEGKVYKKKKKITVEVEEETGPTKAERKKQQASLDKKKKKGRR